MRPKMTSDERPPAVTMARKTLSDSRGSVVMVRGEGTGRRSRWISVVATDASWSKACNQAWQVGEQKVNEK